MINSSGSAQTEQIHPQKAHFQFQTIAITQNAREKLPKYFRIIATPGKASLSYDISMHPTDHAYRDYVIDTMSDFILLGYTLDYEKGVYQFKEPTQISNPWVMH